MEINEGKREKRSPETVSTRREAIATGKREVKQ